MQHDIRMDMRTQPVKVLPGSRIIGNVRNILDAKTNLCLRTTATVCTTFGPNILSLSALNLSVSPSAPLGPNILSPNILSPSALSLVVVRLSVTRARTIRSNAEGRAGIRHAPRVLC
ncbi:MAG: hypothetical protein LKI34_09785 [Bifidobacterium tibiigranuli]|jgi:hypothetical protein|uniref:hypothetical protein n=1 Tax=Bifidobacterium tibiigranuli TaxID=2172043 RepID=UPI0026EF3D4C|nr:hypothetical protein [Bifidobacterium tibiigranuli]MCI1674488.1 hypothetical protein [Bifidobacterium tibiigranuli]MCI1713053.1 hypothetical protein [Bifidobacterium tibiigranuli]MCI1834420.1 hypothetical protein [Bifidobacterium tibiigranuli]